MEQFFQIAAVGIADGSIYGALALGLVLIHRASGIVNFAQGAFAMFGAFMVYEATVRGMPVLMAVIMVAAAAIVVGALVERVAIRPIAHRDELSVVILTVGFSFLVESVATLIWGGDNRPLASIFGGGTVALGGVRLTWHSIGTVLLLLLLTTVLWAFLRYTLWGLAVRAGAVNAETAALLGIPVGRTRMLGWGVALGLAVVAGALIAPRLYLDVTVMSTVLILALAAACLGGFDSLWGAMIAGWIVGLVESLVTNYVTVIGTDLRAVIPLLVILLTLTFKPAGLFSTNQAARV